MTNEELEALAQTLAHAKRTGGNARLAEYRTTMASLTAEDRATTRSHIAQRMNKHLTAAKKPG